MDEVWSLDIVSHGDSALINAGKLPEMGEYHTASLSKADDVDPTADAAEFARDLLAFMLHYMPPKSVQRPPTHLESVSFDETRLRRTHGYRDRRVVGLAHSVSGTMALSAIDSPALFDALILVDPVIVSPLFAERLHRARAPIVFASLQRRREWRTREEAFQFLSKSPFFKAWDRDVLQSFVRFAMTYHPDEGAILKTSPWQVCTQPPHPQLLTPLVASFRRPASTPKGECNRSAGRHWPHYLPLLNCFGSWAARTRCVSCTRCVCIA